MNVGYISWFWEVFACNSVNGKNFGVRWRIVLPISHGLPVDGCSCRSLIYETMEKLWNWKLERNKILIKKKNKTEDKMCKIIQKSYYIWYWRIWFAYLSTYWLFQQCSIHISNFKNSSFNDFKNHLTSPLSYTL